MSASERERVRPEPRERVRAREATRRWRLKPYARVSDNERRKAYNRATSRLRDRHRDEFDELFAEELAATTTPCDCNCHGTAS